MNLLKHGRTAFKDRLPPIIRILTTRELLHMEKLLPRPDHIETVGESTCSIYTAKTIHSTKWRRKVLYRLVVEARKKYQYYYGEDVPLHDEYDAKSAVYLALVSVPAIKNNKRVLKKKWYSLRFVPTAREPFSSEDIDYYVHINHHGKKTPVVELIHKKVPLFKKKPREEIYEYMYTHSRFCSITTYIDKSAKSAGSIEHSNPSGGSPHMYAGLAYALMNKLFIEDLEENGIPAHIMTSQSNTIMTDVILSFSRGNKRITLPFQKARTHLSIEDGHHLAIDRQRSMYAYPCPGYFLDMVDVMKVLQKLHDENRLPKKVVQKFLPRGRSFNAVAKNPVIRDFRFLGRLFTHEGQIEGASIDSKELCDILDKEVKDAPELYIMLIEEWKKGIDELLIFAKE